MWTILGYVMAWDIEHILHVQKIERDENMLQDVAQKVSFNNKEINARLSKWKYVNNLTDVQDRANSPNM